MFKRTHILIFNTIEFFFNFLFSFTKTFFAPLLIINFFFFQKNYIDFYSEKNILFFERKLDDDIDLSKFFLLDGFDGFFLEQIVVDIAKSEGIFDDNNFFVCYYIILCACKEIIKEYLYNLYLEKCYSVYFIFKSVFLYNVSFFISLIVSYLQNNIFYYSYSYFIGIHTIYILCNFFLVFSIINTSNNISMFFKIFIFLFTNILYMFVLNLDPWACFLLIAELSAIFLLTILLNSLKNKNIFNINVNINKVYFFFISFFFIFLINIVSVENTNLFYINYYKNNLFYSNTDFFGVVILLFNNTFLMSLVIFIIIIVSLYILIFFFKKQEEFSSFKDKFGFFFNKIVGSDYIQLIDLFFIKTKPFILKWFKKN